MRNPVVIIITIVLLAILGFTLFFIVQDDQDSIVQKDTAMNGSANSGQDPAEASGQANTADTRESDRYVEYSKAALDQAAPGRRVLFFFANWCPTCRPADASFRENESKIPEDVTVIRVNYNDTETNQEEKDLAAKYAVTYQHTYVQIDGQGKEITAWNGGQMKELLENIQ